MWFQLGGWNLRCDRMRCNALHYALSRTLSPREVSCVRRTAPTYKPITPMVRIDAMEQRLDAMPRAICNLLCKNAAPPSPRGVLTNRDPKTFSLAAHNQELVLGHMTFVLQQLSPNQP